MNKLETVYRSWTWELRSYVLDLQNQLTNQIQKGEVKEIKRSSTENQFVIWKNMKPLSKNLKDIF